MVVRVLIACASLSLVGCLITDEVEFPDELTCPPSIETPPTCTTDSTPPCFPLNRIVHVDLRDRPMSLTFTVDIRDCNEDQELQALWLLNFRPDFGRPLAEARLFEQLVVPEQRESYSFTVDLSTIEAQGAAPRCHKLELLLSGDFRFGEPTPTPSETGDLGTAVWWIAVTDAGSGSVNVEDCQ